MKFDETSLPVLHIPEPPLGFFYDQTSPYPKDGLFLYGPHRKPSKTPQISIGVIGRAEGIAHFKTWAEKIKHRIEVPPPKRGEKKNRLHLSNFPGIEEAFNISFDPAEIVAYEIDFKELDKATRTLNLHEAVSKAIDVYTSKVRHHTKNEERTIDVWILILPELVFERCKPKAKRTGLALVKGDFGKKQVERADLPLLEEVIDQAGEEIFDDIPDFHRQAKAAFLKLNFTSQLIRETTLAPEAFLNKAGYQSRRLQDAATVGWNLATGLYYKTQAEPPWKLASARQGVAYIGLVYKVLPNDPSEHACCAAQMFLAEGDGVVFRGANGPWQTGRNEFHLQPDAAKNLIKQVLDTYDGKHGGPPKELFIHGRTTFQDDEWKAFESAVPKETTLVGVRIKTTYGETKLFRNGDYPVLRGTAIILDAHNAYLWTTGYVPQLDTYIGPETPNPIFISVLRSSREMPHLEDVLGDIMGLTKINYNACNFNDGLPVTVRFADKVGDVLSMGSAKGAEKQPFKFYV
ncbi:argonaute/piwi family protein [Bradyrhizobium iriomotense]|uniref:Piwi domain-containing protein n=1 Tax=Bradyrhizobium iriomotense TaxID=441950 RepID=A0ABQ6ASE1_9BRAD|nr:hypothetical protein [Bradyrhizobium iriomotense]GLR84360.1 hypothetical protein GCM10007857_10700 [Bradyrhizobium iriomotense]